MDDLEFLRGLEPFRTLGKREAKRLLAEAPRRTFAPGSLIVRKGDPGDAMYLLLDGRVEVPVTDEAGRVRFVAYLKAGDVFGEMALLTGDPRTADVVVSAEGPASCRIFPKDALDGLLRAHPPVAAFLTEILGKRLLEDNALRRVGSYQIVREIGRGAMAIVFEGFHTELPRRVAVKMLSHGLVYRSDFAERFRREAKTLGALRHEAVVEVFDAAAAYGTWFLVMELLEGDDLERIATKEGPLPPDEVRRIVLAVAGALRYAHGRGVIHRDIKPSNVFRLPSGQLKLVDFGIATGPVDASAEEEILCSPGYVAPEVVEGRTIDGRTDLYSLGILAFRLLVGRLPFAGADVATLFDAHVKTPCPDIAGLVPDCPQDLVEFVRRAAAKRPADRFPDAAAVEAFLGSPRAGGAAGRPETLRVTVTYPVDSAAPVQAALDAFQGSLREVPGVATALERPAPATPPPAPARPPPASPPPPA